MNIVLLVVDSLRYEALAAQTRPRPRTPFLDRLARQTVCFRRAHATECWTLPTHMSMFTGLLPSQHGAHFASMAYTGSAPTIAELLTADGYHTEVITRNSIFDGSLPGVTRGFQRNTPVLADLSGLNPLAIILALSKPRFRRQILTSGFFHPAQRESRRFVAAFARATVPADREAMACLLERMAEGRRTRRPYFLFCNLYDVHAPYPPAPRSIFRPFWTRNGLAEMVTMPVVLPKLGGHRYLQRGFRMSALSRRLLLQRYHDAIAMMDAKLQTFYDAARAAGLLDDTLLVVTSDHGEGFGEHDLYLHDASVYQTHLHVPLYVHHPEVAPTVVDDVVSTRDLFGLFRAAAAGGGAGDTLLDGAYRAAHPVALAEHFAYPHVVDALPRYRHGLTAAIAGDHKVILRGEQAELYDLRRDAGEGAPQVASIEAFRERCRQAGIPAAAAAAATEHLRSRQAWGERSAA